MPQANFVLAALVVAFLIFITSRGELPKYAAVFVGPNASGGETSTPTKTAAASDNAAAPASGDSLTGVNDALNTVKKTAGAVRVLGEFFK